MLHIIKLAVGVRDVDHLREIQRHRLQHDPPLRHLTRSFPKRANDVLDGGSMYWVIAGAITVRQRLLQITHAQREDGTPCAGLILDHSLVPVVARLIRPFQGWRYLEASAAPPDLDAPHAQQGHNLPAAMAQELRALCLL